MPDDSSPQDQRTDSDNKVLLPTSANVNESSVHELHVQMLQAVNGWLLRSPSERTRDAYRREFAEFREFAGIGDDRFDLLTQVRPEHVARWRNVLLAAKLENSTVRRKLTVVRSLYSYLQICGYPGANPAHAKLVVPPAVSKDGKTVALSPKDCRRLLEAQDVSTPAGIRERAIFGVLAYRACRVGELVRLKVSDFKTDGEHRVVRLFGKGDKERDVPIPVEAIEWLNAWLVVARIEEDRDGPLFRPALTPRGRGRDGFHRRHLTVRSVEHLIRRYAQRLNLDPDVVVHSLRVTALTNASGARS